MDKVSCSFCGEEYSSELSRCPECGEKNQLLSAAKKGAIVDDADILSDTGDEYDEIPVKDYNERKKQTPEKIPVWLKVLILVVAGIAVILGVFFMMLQLGMIDFGTYEPAATVSDFNIDTTPAVTPDVIPSDDITPDDTQVPEPTSDDTQLPEETEPAVTEEPTVDEPEIICNSVTINRTDISFFSRGEVCNFNIICDPGGIEKYAVWESSDPKVVKVDQAGSATAVSGGTAYVTVTVGGQVASCIVRCQFEAGEVMSLEVEDITMTTIGEKASLKIADELDASQKAALVWSSDDTSVATVDQNGNVEAVGGGTTKIKAVTGDMEATCVVRVNVATVSTSEGTVVVTMNHTDVTMRTIGEYVQLKVETPSESVDTSNLVWKSSDDSIATVDQTGLVKAIGNGNATITTTVAGSTVSCIVRVSLG